MLNKDGNLMYEIAWFLLGFLFATGAFVALITNLGSRAEN